MTIAANSLVGGIAGGILGYAITKIERQSTEATHTVIGTLIGAALGTLAGHHILKTGGVNETARVGSSHR